VLLREVIDKGIDLAHKTIEKKNPELRGDEKDRVAKEVALGALKYEMLKDHRATDIVFDWKRMLDFSGNSGPYLQYTFARMQSIEKKVPASEKPDFKTLTHETELALIKHLLTYSDALAQSGQTNSPHHLASYLYELANRLNRFYEKVRIAGDEEAARQAARLILLKTVKGVLARGLRLLGITALEQV
jgi:arginyl-tRNA synthetase